MAVNRIAAIVLVLAFPGLSFGADRVAQLPVLSLGVDAANLAESFADRVFGLASSPASAPAAAHHHAREAAKTAKHAADVANKVAEHSVNITGHAKKALRHALGALHDARVDSSGLNKEQKTSLRKAEARLRVATKKAEYGDLKKDKMQEALDKSSNSGSSEKEELLQQIDELRKTLKEKNVNDTDVNKALDELEADIKASDGTRNDEFKAEIERLRELIDKLADPHKVRKGAARDEEGATPVQEKGIDIDTQMPYGELEPFGREDTAQELTESSIKESDEMVDQLERAEVAEEKRAVFRALTRLRGAAITSFDGVARSQTGNIDTYNKVHKWRKTHPVHHLADEESDVAKWAFPENADFIQTANKTK